MVFPLLACHHQPHYSRKSPRFDLLFDPGPLPAIADDHLMDICMALEPFRGAKYGLEILRRTDVTCKHHS